MTALVDIVPHKPRSPRRLGLATGLITIMDDFDAPSTQLERDFYGD